MSGDSDHIIDNQSAFKFTAFISYSHKDSDWAKWIQRQIEHYRLPARLAKEQGIGRKLGKVFRDREELSTGQNLGDHLLDALNNSANLIVICSPHAVNSQWVGQEIEHFKAIGRGNRIFCLLVDGGAESLPPQLLTNTAGEPLEPLAADPREHADGRRLAKLKLIAGMLELQLDQLVQRDRARQRYLMSLYFSGLMAFLAVGTAAYLSYLNQRHEQEQATKLVGFVVSKWDELRPWIPLDLLISISEEPIAYLESKGTENLPNEAQATYALAVRQLGLAYQDQNENEKAIFTLDKSRQIFQRLVALEPNNKNYAFEIGQSDYYLGANFYYGGDYTSASAPWRSYALQMASLQRTEPENATYVLENVNGVIALLSLKIAAQTLVPEMSLSELLETAIATAESAIIRFPNDADMLEALVGAIAFSADFYMQQCNIQRVLPILERASDAALKAMTLEPSLYRKQTAAGAVTYYANSAFFSGNLEIATTMYIRSLQMRDELSTADPTNDFYQQQALESLFDLFRINYLQLDGDAVPEYSKQIMTRFTDSRERARSYDLEIPWLQIMAEYAIAELGNSEAEKWTNEFKSAVIQLSDDDERKTRALAKLKWQTRYLSLEDDIEFEPGDHLDKQDCRSRFVNWSWNLANGNIDAANQIARDLIDLGYKHPRMAFYSKLAGVPYPPPNTPPPSLDQEETSTPASIQ